VIPLVFSLVACGWLDASQSGPPPGDHFDGPPRDAGEDVGSPPTVDPNPPAPETTDPRATDCPRVFTQDDANAAFAVLAEAPGACPFEGVKVEGSAMLLRWKPTPAKEIRFTVRPAGCGPGEALGAVMLEAPADAKAACPDALSLLRRLAGSGELPTGTDPLQENP
jgi:hypothetical protein